MANLFTTQTPALTNVSEAQPVTVGITFTVAVPGNITGGRFYAPTTVGAGTFELALWQVTADDVPAASGTGTLLGTVAFGALTPGVWNTAVFASPIAVTTGAAYRIGVRTSEGRYTATGGFFNSALTNGNLTGIQTGTDPVGIGALDNGNFIESITAYPNKTFGGNAYFVDPDFTPTAATTGTASIVLPPLSAATSGAATATGTAAVVLPPLTAPAAGTVPPTTATSALTLPALKSTAAGSTLLGAGYTDPEVLIGRWLHGFLGVKVRVDPGLPDQWKWTAPLVHVQRGQSVAGLALTLDDVTVDIDVYAANADHARRTAHDVGTAIELHLPKTTFDNGVFVTYAAAITRPMWAPDPALFRRTAAYRVILHGLA